MLEFTDLYGMTKKRQARSMGSTGRELVPVASRLILPRKERRRKLLESPDRHTCKNHAIRRTSPQFPRSFFLKHDAERKTGWRSGRHYHLVMNPGTTGLIRRQVHGKIQMRSDRDLSGLRAVGHIRVHLHVERPFGADDAPLLDGEIRRHVADD